MPLIIVFCLLLIFWCLCVFGALTLPAWVPLLVLATMLGILGWKSLGALIKG